MWEEGKGIYFTLVYWILLRFVMNIDKGEDVVMFYVGNYFQEVTRRLTSVNVLAILP